MKSDKLQDAIGLVDSTLINRAGNSMKRTRKRTLRWNVPVAAVLIFSLCIGIIIHKGITEPDSLKPALPQPDSQVRLNSYEIFKAEYPTMAKLSADYSYEEYKEWSKANRERPSYPFKDDNSYDYLKATIEEFLAGSDGENKLYSPTNIYLALAMLAEISDGESRQQILDLLGESSIENLRSQAHAIWYSNYCDDGMTTSILANSLWLNNSAEYKADALNTLAEYYYASSFSGEMGSDDYNKQIQIWLNEQTGGLLEDMTETTELDASTVIALYSTLYFNAQWTDSFSESKTFEGDFHAPTGIETCDFMNQRIEYADYYEANAFSVLHKEFDGLGSMDFILPDENIFVDDVLKSDEFFDFITADGAWYQGESIYGAESVNVNLSVPKFDISSKTDITTSLKNMGVTDCFDSTAADFTPLLPDEEGAFISTVNHGVRVAIDEDGVVGAAYIELILDGSVQQSPPKEVDFTLDRPFIFIINGANELPLFIGIVNHP